MRSGTSFITIKNTSATLTSGTFMNLAEGAVPSDRWPRIFLCAGEAHQLSNDGSDDFSNHSIRDKLATIPVIIQTA